MISSSESRVFQALINEDSKNRADVAPESYTQERKKCICTEEHRKNKFNLMIKLSSCHDLFDSVMGLCFSCCPRSSSDTDSVGPDGDRSRLITDVHADDSNACDTQDSDEEPIDSPAGSYSESYPIGSGIHFRASLPKPKKNDKTSCIK